MKQFFLFSILLVGFLTSCSNQDDAKQFEAKTSKVATYAGIKVHGFKNATTQEVQFFSPMGIAKTEDGLYVADTNNHAIRKIEGKNVITIAGSSSKWDRFGEPIGGFQDGKREEALFNTPTDVAVLEDGTIYVTDSANGAIRRITIDGQVDTIVSDLQYPSHIAIGKNNTLYVSEKLAHRILMIDLNGNVSVLAGGGYLTKDGEIIGNYKDGIGKKAQFNEPTGLVWSDEGYLLVSDTGNQRIRKIQNDGSVTTVAGGGDQFIDNSNYIEGDYKDGDALEARFNFPHGLTLLSDQSLVVADTLNHRLRMIDANGQVSTLAGSGTHGYKDGIGSSVSFDGPTDLAADETGIYIADRYNHMIRFLSFNEKTKAVKQ